MHRSWRPLRSSPPLVCLVLLAACGSEPQPSLAARPIVLPSQGTPPPPRPKSLAETKASVEAPKSDAPTPLDELAVDEAELAVLHAGRDTTKFAVQEGALRKVVAAWPRWARPHVGLARLFLATALAAKGKPDPGALAAVETELAAARSLEPKYAPIASVAGELALARGDLAAAALALADAKRLAPDAPETALLEAAVALSRKETATAIALATPAAAQSNPKRVRADAHAFLARLHAAAKQPAKAVPEFKAALEADAGWTALRLELVDVLSADKKTELAMQVAQEADRIESTAVTKAALAGACKRRGENLLATKQPVYSGDAFKCAVAADPTDAEAFYGLGAYYRAVAEAGMNPALLDDSDEAYKAALVLKPGHAKAKAGLAANAKTRKAHPPPPGMGGFPGMPPGMPGIPAGMMPPGMPGMPGMPGGHDGHDD